MKMKKIIIPALLFSVQCFAQSNIYNPYASIGKEAKVLTLSNGRYAEFFDSDSLQRIGSVMFNTATNKIEYFLKEVDTTYQEQLIRPMESSRWFSTDPMAAKYPELSPYAFCLNNPIRYIDPDGRDPIDPRTGETRSISEYKASTVYINPYTTDLDKDMYDDANSFWSGILSDFDNDDTQDMPTPDRVSPLISKSSVALISKKLAQNNTFYNVSHAANPPMLGSLKLAAKSGTYSYIEDNWAETGAITGYADYTSTNLIKVENNFITGIAHLQRTTKGDQFYVSQIYDIKQEFVEFKTVYNDGESKQYNVFKVIETITNYDEAGNVVGDVTTNYYHRDDEVIKKDVE